MTRLTTWLMTTRLAGWTALGVGFLGGLGILGAGAAMVAEPPPDLHDVLGSS